MPAASTHVEFSKDVYNILPKSILAEITNLQMYYLGSQGPDTFFFSRASVFPGTLKKYGDLMHYEKVPEAISFMENYIGDDADLKSYFYGYLCHYALDSICHPLINAVSRKMHEDTGTHEGEYHVTCEGAIDVWIFAQRGRDVSTYDVYKDLAVSKSDAEKLAKMYHELFQEVYGLELSAKKIKSAIHDIAFYTKVLSPKQGSFKVIYGLESLVRMPHAISGMIMLNKTDYAVLNLEHYPYPLIYNEDETISDDFATLYGKAVYVARGLMDHHDMSDFDKNFSGTPSKYQPYDKKIVI